MAINKTGNKIEFRLHCGFNLSPFYNIYTISSQIDFVLKSTIYSKSFNERIKHFKCLIIVATSRLEHVYRLC